MARKKKKKVNDIIEKYLYPSIVFGVMMTVFNFAFLLMSFYSEEYIGIYIDVSNNVLIDTFINIIFDVLLFGGTFFLDFYLLFEKIIFTNKR